MKMTVENWTHAQMHLPKEGSALWNEIENRTWGKFYYQKVAIKLSKSDQAMVNDALVKVEEDRAAKFGIRAR